MSFKYIELSELRTKLDNKEVSSVELTKYFLDNIKNINPELNSFITISEEEALADAKKADEFISGPGNNPALCGIPYAAKDIFLTKGIRTTAGSNILRDYIAPYDATAIKKVKEQHGVLVGKTNCDEFAMGSSNETSAFGPVKNPWDHNRVAGGSSGGSAAAVAGGQVPWALATDTGGSIRSPASFTGLTGWKPTYGRVSRYGVSAMTSSLDSIGALALSVKDIAMIASVTSGKDSMDGTTGDHPADFMVDSAAIKGMKIGIPKEYFVDGMEMGVVTKVKEAIEELKKLGAQIVDISLPNTKYGSLVYAIICPSEVSSNLARFDGIRYGHVSSEAKDLLEVYTKTRAEGFGNEAKRRIMIGTYVLSAGYYDAYYKKAQRIRRLILNEFEEIFKQVDVLIAPTSPMVAPKLGAFADNPLFAYIADVLNIPANLAGLASISVPCGFAKPGDGETSSTDGLPVGLQIIGPQWGEQKIFNVGAAYQEVTDWHKKFPEAK